MILLLLIININTNKTEHFQIVGYNASDIPCNTIESIYTIETKKLINLFKNQDNINFKLDGYTLYNNNISFPYETQIKKVLTDYIKIIFESKEKISISRINNIYFETNGNGNYIFNAQLLNSTNFTTRNLLVKVNILGQLISILSVKLDSNDTSQSEYLPIASGRDILLPDSFYRIKNTMYLLDPFITSSKENIITPRMISDFDKSIQIHQTQLQNLQNKI